jgi:hypothetical protein
MTRIFASYDPADPTVWRLEQPYVRQTSLGELTVPAGFIWNGCSAPRWLWGSCRVGAATRAQR